MPQIHSFGAMSPPKVNQFNFKEAEVYDDAMERMLKKKIVFEDQELAGFDSLVLEGGLIEKKVTSMIDKSASNI